jgi:hypothetical protein
MPSWLYFGLLSEFLEYPVPFDDFLQDRGLVDSSTLEDLISDWERGLSPSAQAQPKAANSKMDRINESLKHAMTFCDMFDTAPYMASRPFPEIILSIQVLISTLKAAYTRWAMTAHLDGSYDGPRNIPGEYARPSRPGAAPKHNERLLHGHLVDNGFRPALARYPPASFDYVTVYYVSLLRRRRSPDPDHGSLL